MALIVVVIAAILLIVFVGVTIGVGFGLIASGSREMASKNAAAQWRIALFVRIAGLVVGGVIAYLLAEYVSTAQFVPAFALVAVSGFVLGVLLSERFVIAPRNDATQVAQIKARSLSSYITLFPALLAVVSTVLLVGALVFATVTADSTADPSTGRVGDSFTVTFESLTCARGPYPGQYYSVPLFIALAVLLLLAVGALVAITRRPSGYGATHNHDEALRSRSVRMVLGAYSAAVCATFAGVCALIAMGLGVGDCVERNSPNEVVPGWIGWSAGVFDGLMMFGIFGFIVSIAVACMPVRAKE